MSDQDRITNVCQIHLRSNCAECSAEQGVWGERCAGSGDGPGGFCGRQRVPGKTACADCMPRLEAIRRELDAMEKD